MQKPGDSLDTTAACSVITELCITSLFAAAAGREHAWSTKPSSFVAASVKIVVTCALAGLNAPMRYVLHQFLLQQDIICLLAVHHMICVHGSHQSNKTKYHHVVVCLC